MTDAPTPDLPTLDLKLPQASVCGIHGEPFRKDWPKGYAQIAILIIETIQDDEELANEAEGDPLRIPALLLERPACERVPRGRLMTMYVDAKIGVDGTCTICGRRRLGTEYQRTDDKGKVATITHVCFDCVLDRLKAT
jgi:hypothetical protein